MPAPALTPPSSTPPLILLGRSAFAAALAFWGFQHFQHGAFVTRAMPPWPEAFPFDTAAAYVFGTLLLLASAAILLRRQARRAATVVAIIVFLGFAFLALPAAFHDVALGGSWTLAGKALVIASGTLVVASTFAIDAQSPTDRLFALFGRVAFAAFLIQSGLQHFRWAVFVQTLVPSWMPFASFWTYFTGVALVAGGIGLLFPRTRRLAALGVGAMIFAWVLLVHVPRAFITVRDANEATALFEAIAFSGLAFLLVAKTAPATATLPTTASPLPTAS